MARKTDIRICRFSECTHADKMIDVSVDDYVADGRSYFHRECFEAREQKSLERSVKQRERAERRLQAEQEALERIEKQKEREERRLQREREAAKKKCRYCDCKHANAMIDTINEEFEIKNRKYYHRDCLKLLEDSEKAEEKIKADIQLIKNMWIENISDTVVVQHLYAELNKLIRERKISSDYVAFVMSYCVRNKCKLRYPGGLKYYVDNQEIKDAYEKENTKKILKNAVFKVDDTTEDNIPKFSVNKKPSGFNSILNRRR